MFNQNSMSSPKIRLFISLSSPQSWIPHPSALQCRHPLDQRTTRQSSHKKLRKSYKRRFGTAVAFENRSHWFIDLIYFLKPQSWRLSTCILNEAQCQVSARTSLLTSAETSPTFQRVIVKEEQSRFCEAILLKPTMVQALQLHFEASGNQT